MTPQSILRSESVVEAVAKALATSWDYRRKDIAWSDLAHAAIATMLGQLQVSEDELLQYAKLHLLTFLDSTMHKGAILGYIEAYREMGLVRCEE